MGQKAYPNFKRTNDYLRGLITERQVARGFGVTLMTVKHWRTAYGLPAYVIPGDERPAVRYDPAHVKHWAKEHGKKYSRTGGAIAA